MRLLTRAHEFLADHVPWIQYPDARFAPRRRFRLSDLSFKQRCWLVFALFWLFVIALSIYGNSLD
jgi:hypothetical protein